VNRASVEWYRKWLAKASDEAIAQSEQVLRAALSDYEQKLEQVTLYRDTTVAQLEELRVEKASRLIDKLEKPF